MHSARIIGGGDNGAMHMPPPAAAAPTPTPESPRPASPCIGVCAIDEASGLCAGCWRTLGEIAAWGQASAEAREQVWQRIALRRAATGEGGPPVP